MNVAKYVPANELLMEYVGTSLTSLHTVFTTGSFKTLKREDVQNCVFLLAALKSLEGPSKFWKKRKPTRGFGTLVLTAVLFLAALQGPLLQYHHKSV